jgi:hypothetical protein
LDGNRLDADTATKGIVVRPVKLNQSGIPTGLPAAANGSPEISAVPVELRRQIAVMLEHLEPIIERGREVEIPFESAVMFLIRKGHGRLHYLPQVKTLVDAYKRAKQLRNDDRLTWFETWNHTFEHFSGGRRIDVRVAGQFRGLLIKSARELGFGDRLGTYVLLCLIVGLVRPETAVFDESVRGRLHLEVERFLRALNLRAFDAANLLHTTRANFQLLQWRQYVSKFGQQLSAINDVSFNPDDADEKSGAYDPELEAALNAAAAELGAGA